MDRRFYPEDFHLARTTSERELVKNAVVKVNKILHVGDSQLFNIPADDFAGNDTIPVFVLSSLNLSTSDVIWVPSGCYCVYIHAFGLRGWLEDVKAADGYGDSFEDVTILAFMLLHEMGHIRSRTSEVFEPRTSGTDPFFNVADTIEKPSEASADLFSEMIIGNALKSQGPPAVVASEIIRSVSIMSNNMYLRAYLTNNLEDATCLTPRIFWDIGYSHPNFTYRLLGILSRLSPSELTRSRLQEYVSCRSQHPRYFN